MAISRQWPLTNFQSKVKSYYMANYDLLRDNF